VLPRPFWPPAAFVLTPHPRIRIQTSPSTSSSSSILSEWYNTDFPFSSPLPAAWALESGGRQVFFFFLFLGCVDLLSSFPFPSGGKRGISSSTILRVEQPFSSLGVFLLPAPLSGSLCPAPLSPLSGGVRHAPGHRDFLLIPMNFPSSLFLGDFFQAV